MRTVGEIGLAFMRCGGKRLRPRLCEAVYRSLAPDGTADLTPLQEALESIHKASLIHDDIQDGDSERYGRPTVWREHGIPLAIAAGDWLLAHGIALVDHAPFANVAEMSKLRSRAMLALCEGQGDELAGVGDYVSVCARKTGALFALAAGLGALAAGADPAPYWEWGVTYGVLFQVLDDIRDEGETPRLAALRDEYAAKLAAREVGPFGEGPFSAGGLIGGTDCRASRRQSS